MFVCVKIEIGCFSESQCLTSINNSFYTVDAWWCVVPVDLSETLDLKALNSILFWKDWDSSAFWILSLPWLLCESHIPHYSNASQWHHFHQLLDSIIQHQYTKVQLDAIFFFSTLSIASLLCPPSFSKHPPPSMFYQAVLEECTALLNIIVSPGPKSPSSCDVSFIAQISSPLLFSSEVRRLLCWLEQPCTIESEISVFKLVLQICSYMPFVLLNAWKRVCNQGGCRAKLSFEYFWIQL